MTVYVRAARRINPPSVSPRGGEVTGSVLHLATFQLEDSALTTVPMGRWLPLCGGRQFVRPVERWALTGPSFKLWPGHSHWPLCRRCARALGVLWAAATEQDARLAQHQRATILAESITAENRNTSDA